MPTKKLSFKAFTALFLLSKLQAFYLPPFVVSGDVDYEIIKAPKQEVIYAHFHHKEAEDLLEKAQYLHQSYAKSFDFNLTQTNYTALASQHNQISNGYATFLPLLMNGFYSGGAAQIDSFGSLSWIDTLLIHEFAHTYQLDAKTKSSQQYQSIIGNNGLWFINPNYLLPTLIIEGNAVMNESRFNIGGRLYVGEHRALVYALSKDKKLNYTRLLNNHISFPYGREKYLVGGYFWAYIAQRFGTSKANGFFKQHAVHYINPLQINRSFKEHFDRDYRSLIDDFLKDLELKSKDMRFLEGEELSFAHRLGAFNANQDQIFWMQSDEMGPNVKAVYDKKGTLVTQATPHLLDKLFVLDNRFYTSSQSQINPSEIISGLFDEELKLLPSSKDHYLLDRRGGHEVSFFIPDSYDRAKLYKDQKYVTQADASAILDDEGHVYYVKQRGQERQLYKDATIIARWQGYSLKLLEVRDAKVYFIAPTLGGSSLFCVDQGRIIRLSSADNIVDARLIDDERFLAATVRGDGFHIIKAKLETAKAELPAWYEYDLTQEALALPSDSHKSQAHAYSPLTNLHYGGIYSFGLGYGSGSGFSGNLGLFFVDPMHQNELLLYGMGSQYSQNAYASYENRKYLWNYGLFASYYQHASEYSSGTDMQLGLRLKYSWVETDRKTASITLKPRVEKLDKVDSRGIDTTLSYSYHEAYGYAYDWHKYYAWYINHSLDDTGSALSFTLKTVNELFSHDFVKSEWAYHHANNFLTLSNWSGTSFENSSARALSIYSRRMWLQTKEAYKINLSNAYAFKTGLYFDVWPFSLRRSAILLGANYVYTLGNAESAASQLFPQAPFDFYELKAGLDFELLGAHLAPFNCTIAINYNSYLKDTEYILSLGISY